MHRRRLAWLALLPLAARAQADPVGARLRAGGCAVLLRHAQTTPGIGDPPGFRLEACGTQRNLSDQGRTQASRIGEWFVAQRLRPRAVRSSEWCRCRDTAQLAFGNTTPWPPLNSIFDNDARAPAANQALRVALASIPAGAFEVWVTHQVNITALTGEFAAMAEAVVVDAEARVLARTRFVAS